MSFIFSSEPTTCEAGWIPWRSSCYGIIKGLAKKWSDAQADCKRRFGDLLIINDQEEQDFITNEISTLDVVCFTLKINQSFSRDLIGETYPFVCNASRDLAPFVQFKNVKSTLRGVLFLVKLQD